VRRNVDIELADAAHSDIGSAETRGVGGEIVGLVL
jgi:hypothetical protein